MSTYEVTTLEPKAEAMLDEMESEKLITKKKRFENGAQKKSKKKDRAFGSMPGLVIHISDDFDEPLDDFAEYM